MRNRRAPFTLSLIALLLAGIAGCTDSTTEPGECGACDECVVTPITHSDVGGTVDPKRGGDYEFTSGKLDGDRKRGGAVGPITWTTDPTGTYVSWSVSSPHYGIAIVVKGGAWANVYVYDAECLSGTELVCPTNDSGKPAQLSNITFYWNECPDGC